MKKQNPSTALDPTSLLTVQAKHAAYVSLFGGKHAHPDELFLPTREFYDQLRTESGLAAAAKQLYQWVGIKPRHLHATYSADTGTYHTQDGHLQIAAHYQSLPYQTGALLALAVLTDVVGDHMHYGADRAFLEYLTIETGLGLLLANGLCPPHAKWESILHKIHGEWHSNLTIDLQTYRTINYVDELKHYASARHLSTRRWSSYLQPNARRQFGLGPHSSIAQPLAMIERARQRKVYTNALSIVLIAFCGGAAATIGAYVWSQRPEHVSGAAIAQYQRVAEKQHAYDQCQSSVRTQLNGSESNDVYADQRLNAAKAECMSLMNQYNAEVSRYNALLR